MLGTSPDTLSTFSVEFQQGMVTESRAFALGDVAESDPRKWEWGGKPSDLRELVPSESHDVAADEVHALVLVYAKSAQALDGRAAALRTLIEEAGCHVLYDVRSEMLGDRKEHFGFVDGISQPAVQGYDPPKAPRTRRSPPASSSSAIRTRTSRARTLRP